MELTFPSAVELNLREIRGLLKIIVVYKEVEAYEEQGILEDGDTDHRDGADSTDHHTGSERLRSVAQASE